MKTKLVKNIKSWAGKTVVRFLPSELLSQYKSKKRIRQELKNLNPINCLHSGELVLQYKGNKDMKRIRLHLGCGLRKRQGWINIDIDKKAKPDIVADVQDLSMFTNETVDEIDCCHLFEHLTYLGATAALEEWYRVLKKGGKLSLELPNLERCIEILYKKESVEAVKSAMIGLYGFIPEIQKYGISLLHKYGWTPETLTKSFEKVGFSNIKQVPVTQTWRESTKYNRDMRFECQK